MAERTGVVSSLVAAIPQAPSSPAHPARQERGRQPHDGIAAGDGTSTRAFAWLRTGVSAGFSAGAALAGPAAALGGAAGAFGVCPGAVTLAIVIVFAGRRRLDATPASAT